MLQVEGLDITYSGKKEVHAVRKVSFSVIPGKITTLFGQSGSGKTAITMAVLGLLPLHSVQHGTISWKETGKEVVVLSSLTAEERRKWIGEHIGWVSQGAQRALSPTRSIESLLREAIKVNGNLPANKVESEISDLLADLGLPESVRKAFPDQLSGGQRQRCLLALALINRPKILIADEPTTSLDVLNEHKLLKLLHKIQASRNIGILFITHDLRITRDFVGPCYYMEQGSFVIRGDSAKDVMKELYATKGSFTFDNNPSPPPSPGKRMPVLLEIHKLSVTYHSQGGLFSQTEPVKAVQQIDLSLDRGESLGLVGASGSGKSSLARAIAGVLPYAGQITWEDTSTTALRKTQLILQDSFSSLHPRFTVEKTLQEVIRIHSPDLSSPEIKALALSYLEQVQLTADYLSRYPNQLSGGERQRVSLARSLAAKPELLLLDESISSLDFDLQRKMIDLIYSLQSMHQLSLIVISHDFRVVRNLCQRIIVMEAGKIIENGRTESLIQQPQHDHTKALLEASGLPVSGLSHD